MRIVHHGTINGAFTGFNSDMLFRLTDHTYWLQAVYKYWYHYAYRPKVEIGEDGDRLFLRLQGDQQSVQVRKISDVIESQINGTFKGWHGHSEYELTNGQEWEQSEYKYEYHYAHRPEVIVYETSTGCVMDVDGHSAMVRRR